MVYGKSKGPCEDVCVNVEGTWKGKSAEQKYDHSEKQNRHITPGGTENDSLGPVKRT
jgi:hypothetical protein